MDILEVRYHTQHRDATELLQHVTPLIKETQVATELIYQDALDTLTILRSLQRYAAIDRGKHPPSVDIPHQYHVGLGVSRHRHIDQVRIPQVDLRDAPCPFHHNGMVTGGQTVESLTHLCAEVDI